MCFIGDVSFGYFCNIKHIVALNEHDGTNKLIQSIQSLVWGSIETLGYKLEVKGETDYIVQDPLGPKKKMNYIEIGFFVGGVG